jgi:hypothetical protein
MRALLLSGLNTPSPLTGNMTWRDVYELRMAMRSLLEHMYDLQLISEAILQNGVGSLYKPTPMDADCTLQ